MLAQSTPHLGARVREAGEALGVVAVRDARAAALRERLADGREGPPALPARVAQVLLLHLAETRGEPPKWNVQALVQWQLEFCWYASFQNYQAG